MSENSKIEWTDHTFNGWEGCQKVGPGCDHCYAETRNARFAGGTAVNWGPGAQRRRTSAANWRKPLAWNAQPFVECVACRWRGARRNSVRRGPNDLLWEMCPSCGAVDFTPARARVFCSSLSDWLDNQVDVAWLVDLLDLWRKTPNLDKLALTKRIGNWRTRLEAARDHAFNHRRDELHEWISAWLDGQPPADVWLGATIVNQAEADRDIPKLLDVPARVRFLSMEPLLGPVDLTSIPWGGHRVSVLQGWSSPEHGLHWVIVGGESGHGARPMHPDWARSLRDQCAAAGVAFHFKQHGEWAPGSGDFGAGQFETAAVARDGRVAPGGHRVEDYPLGAASADGWAMVHRAGKRAAGRLLDDRMHDEFPSAQS
ncbi:phage Gp37/Gp68 family protein [Burkholderia pyrrocinia]|uniref:phage Gp37/Gp68 family protein n=1 Tax=Burkholderia pyrrocinia TaxID=60550 RepID=UPI0038B60A2E